MSIDTSLQRNLRMCRRDENPTASALLLLGLAVLSCAGSVIPIAIASAILTRWTALGVHAAESLTTSPTMEAIRPYGGG